MAHEQHLIVVQDKRTHAEKRRTRDAPEQIARCVGDAIEQCQRSVCQALLHITVVQ
jgi:16S rRNA U1498 N3-methylase RsmE